MIHSSAPELRRIDSTAFGTLSQPLTGGCIRLRFQEQSGSMRPWICPGDILEVSPTSLTDLHRGQVVLVRLSGGMLLARRIVHVTGSGVYAKLLVQGDAEKEPEGEIPAEWVMGRVTRIECQGKSRLWGTGKHRLLGSLWCALLPAWRVMQAAFQ